MAPTRRARNQTSSDSDSTLTERAQPETSIRVSAPEFHAHVYDRIREIPYGQVTTYAHIAKLCGHPRHARMVGQALRHLGHGDPDDPEPVPWWRVLNARGGISPRGSVAILARQARLLRQEGIIVNDPTRDDDETRVAAPDLHTEGGRVNLTQFGWFPEPETS